MKITMGPAPRLLLFLLCRVIEAHAGQSPGSEQSIPTGTESGTPDRRIAKVAILPAANPAAGPEQEGSETLEIDFDDQHVETVRAELVSGRGGNEEPVHQSGFSLVQIAPDHLTVGWLATYMICAQSYPCPAELVIYRSGHVIQRLPPPYGIVWDWAFRRGARQVVMHSGFPHGDVEGVSTLFDIKSGRRLGSYTNGPHKPAWVESSDENTS